MTFVDDVRACDDRMVNGPEIAVIVCTRNRASALRQCLGVLADVQFEAAAWELVVVNNGGTDQTNDLVHAFAARVPFRVTLVQEPRRGLSYARNCGVASSSATILAFTDDDCYAASDYLTRIREAFAGSEYGYIGGRILLHDPLDAPETIKPDEVGEEVPPFTCVTPGFIHGANMAIRREVLTAVGGFDPVFGAGQRFAAEDVELLARASAAGWKGAYLPGPVVRHHHGRRPGPDIESLRRTYAKGRGAYYAKGCCDPRMRRNFLRSWYWSLRARVKRRELATILQELAGGAEYLWWRWSRAEPRVDEKTFSYARNGRDLHVEPGTAAQTDARVPDEP